jgi:hypothetical protein
VGKRTRTLPYPMNGRIRITVELCPASAAALQEILDGFNKSHGDLGYSPIIRAALLQIFRDGSWSKLEVESLKQARDRQELRKLHRPTKPTLDFTKQ